MTRSEQCTRHVHKGLLSLHQDRVWGSSTRRTRREGRRAMKTRSRMRERYRRLSFLDGHRGMKNALGEMPGLFFRRSPS